MGFALDELGPVRCREIAETLFRVQKDYAGRSTLNGWCPFHEEKNPSFAYHYGEDWYKCRGCGEGGDLVKLWLHVHGGAFLDFKREFCGDDAPAPRPRKEKAAKKPGKEEEKVDPGSFVPEEELERLPPLPEARIRELQASRRWTPETIFMLDLREFTDPAGGKRIAIPIRDDAG
ncbi:MAG: hypothetical protein GX751_12220, partial [Desulfuromonadaceae bacterium]|nr:hypothetical protein [Desulfuromonadaceae bacterium]